MIQLNVRNFVPSCSKACSFRLAILILIASCIAAIPVQLLGKYTPHRSHAFRSGLRLRRATLLEHASYPSITHQTPARLTHKLLHNLTSPTAEWLRRTYQRHMLDLPSSLQWVWPSAADQLCGCFAKTQAAQVVLVGNGPLSVSQRKDIAKADCIVRFNQLNNRQQGDRTDIWFVRGSFFPAGNLTRQVAQEAKWVVLAHAFRDELPSSAENQKSSAAELRSHWSAAMNATVAASGLGAAEQAKMVAVDLSQHQALWDRVATQLGYPRRDFRHRGQVIRGNNPSSGLVALLAVLDCLPGDATIHLYGFNWSSRNWAGHLMTLERSFIQAFSPQLAGRLLVHPTPCNSYRECEEV